MMITYAATEDTELTENCFQNAIKPLGVMNACRKSFSVFSVCSVAKRS